MTWKAILLLTVALAAFAAEDDWAKVRAIKSGTEVRIVKRGSLQPVLAKMDEANDENLLVVVKNEQVAIPRDAIERIDARPAQTGSRITKETKTTSEPPDPKAASPTMVKRADGPSSSTSSSISVGSRPDFETVYRRKAGGPKK